jgi:hypothetical protein
MLALIAALSGVFLLTPLESVLQDPANPVATFLRAADQNDVPAMEAVLDRSGSNFLGKISNCYLRRVYQSPEGITAAWMCAEGPARSRVVIARVGLTSANRVAVAVVREDVNDRPAPERAGSAFAD